MCKLRYGQDAIPPMNTSLDFLPQDTAFIENILNLTRRLSGLEILNNKTLIIQKWLVSRLFQKILKNFYDNFRNFL